MGGYLSHGHEDISIKFHLFGGEEWQVVHTNLGGPTFCYIECLGGETGKFLSHANNTVRITSDCSTNEKWLIEEVDISEIAHR